MIDTAQRSDTLKCFNAAKNWKAGWYSDKAVTVDPRSGSWFGKLAAYVDYKSVDNSYTVLIKIGNYYMQFNKEKGINADSPEKEDTVTIVYASTLNAQSNLVHGLGLFDPTYRIQNFMGSGSDAVIQACRARKAGSIDYMEVSIFLDNGVQSSTCEGGEPEVPGHLINHEACWDIGYVDQLPSKDDCANRCKSSFGCVSYSYNHGLWYKRCHLCR